MRVLYYMDPFVDMDYDFDDRSFVAKRILMLIFWENSPKRKNLSPSISPRWNHYWAKENSAST